MHSSGCHDPPCIDLRHVPFPPFLPLRMIVYALVENRLMKRQRCHVCCQWVVEVIVPRGRSASRTYALCRASFDGYACRVARYQKLSLAPLSSSQVGPLLPGAGITFLLRLMSRTCTVLYWYLVRWSGSGLQVRAAGSTADVCGSQSSVQGPVKGSQSSTFFTGMSPFYRPHAVSVRGLSFMCECERVPVDFRTHGFALHVALLLVFAFMF